MLDLNEGENSVHGCQDEMSVVSNARIRGWNETVDIYIADGVIADIKSTDRKASAREFDEANVTTLINAEGNVVLPGLCDAHTHIDKTYSPELNPQGDLLGAISAMSRYKQKRDLAMIEENARRALNHAISHGVTHLRSHIDLGSRQDTQVHDLDIVQALVEIRDEFKHRIKLDFIALGATQAADELSLMERAIELGVDWVGGVPALSDDPSASVKNAVDLAMKLGKGLDLHIDEHENPELSTLEMLADYCIREGVSAPTIASHCVNLAYMPDDQFRKIAEKIKEANISIIGLPVCNLTLMGRSPHGTRASPRGIAPIKALQKRNVNVSIASDNVQDPFNPFGHYDPLSVLNITCIACHLTEEHELDTAIDLISRNPSHATHMQGGEIRTNTEANLVITNAVSERACILHPPERLATIFRGQLVYEKKISESWYSPMTVKTH